MGGETILTPRFEEFVDFMTANKRFDLSMSFVTNGTKFNESLINKLKQFTRVGIEVSIETTTAHNDYVRQGTDTKTVLENIKLYQQHCNNTSISLTLRPAVSALTVGYYYTLLEYCLENKLTIKSLLVTTPSYLNVNVLPKHIKEQYSKNYHNLLEKLTNINIDTDYNESDPNNYLRSIKLQAQQILSLLEQSGSEDQLKDLVGMCSRWDREFNFNARKLYPELAEVFTQHGY
jgi:sulfatase maturation enzyme AslB (radical SAM superfamily)